MVRCSGSSTPGRHPVGSPQPRHGQGTGQVSPARAPEADHVDGCRSLHSTGDLARTVVSVLPQDTVTEPEGAGPVLRVDHEDSWGPTTTWSTWRRDVRANASRGGWSIGPQAWPESGSRGRLTFCAALPQVRRALQPLGLLRCRLADFPRRLSSRHYRPPIGRSRLCRDVLGIRRSGTPR